MKHYCFLMSTILFVSFSLIACNPSRSANPSQTALHDLEVLTNDMEANHASYTEEDWENAAASYAAVKEELAKYKYTDEEIKEISRLKGKCSTYFAKRKIHNATKQIGKTVKKLGGNINGCIEALSDDSKK